MASVSYSMTRGNMIDDLTNGTPAIAVGTSAPGAGDIEVHIDVTKNLGIREIRDHLETIWRQIANTPLSLYPNI